MTSNRRNGDVTSDCSLDYCTEDGALNVVITPVAKQQDPIEPNPARDIGSCAVK